MLLKEDYLSGQVLLIDKPLNWTSFQVVNKLRWHIRKAFDIKKIKVGHAGTLDPLATGLLVICTGKMTKQINTFQAQVKEFREDEKEIRADLFSKIEENIRFIQLFKQKEERQV